jgi:GNAT superfamily N-acetyltransferase
MGEIKMIREAEPKDQAAIQHLYEILAPGAPVKVFPERIEEIGKDPNQFLFVYEENGVVLGTVMLVICLSAMFGAQPFGLIEHFVVDEKSRRQGIGSKLTDYAIQVCRAKKCTRVMLLSNADRREAHRFYEHKGFDGSKKKGFVNYLNRTNN